MGGFSIWHVLLFVFALAVPITAIATERSDRRISRQTFIIWFVAVLVITFGLPEILAFAGVDPQTASMIGLPVVLILVIPLYRQYVRRARDAGLGKTIVYLTIIPILSPFTTIYLMIAKPAEGDGAAAEGGGAAADGGGAATPRPDGGDGEPETPRPDGGG